MLDGLTPGLGCWSPQYFQSIICESFWIISVALSLSLYIFHSALSNQLPVKSIHWFFVVVVLSVTFFRFRISILCISFLESPLLSWHFPPSGNSDLSVLSSLSLPLSTCAPFLISLVNCGVPSGEKWDKCRSCPLCFHHFKSYSTFSVPAFVCFPVPSNSCLFDCFFSEVYAYYGQESTCWKLEVHTHLYFGSSQNFEY